MSWPLPQKTKDFHDMPTSRPTLENRPLLFSNPDTLDNKQNPQHLLQTSPVISEGHLCPPMASTLPCSHPTHRPRTISCADTLFEAMEASQNENRSHEGPSTTTTKSPTYQFWCNDSNSNSNSNNGKYSDSSNSNNSNNSSRSVSILTIEDSDDTVSVSALTATTRSQSPKLIDEQEEEEAQLLLGSSGRGRDEESHRREGRDQDKVKAEVPSGTIWQEFTILLRHSAPVVLTYLLQNSLQLASLFYLGHLGSVELAASSLASMFAAVSAWSVALGMATALDTLCSQAFTFSTQDPFILGVYLQRAILILMCFLVPVAGVWLSAERIFEALLGQDESLASLAALYLRGLLPGAPAYLIFECVKKYLQAQGIMHASTYVLLIASPLNVVMTHFLVSSPTIGLGFIGAALATSASYWTMLLLLLAYIRFVDGSQAWGGWSRRSLCGWRQFLNLAIPGVLMVCTEWWAFEVMALAASYLGTVSLAAHSIVTQTSGLLYTIPFGISVAASNRVGNLLGAGADRQARTASLVSIMMAVGFGTINSALLVVLGRSWGGLFSDEAEVVSAVAGVLPFVALYQISDGLASVGGGVLRGIGSQHLGAYLNMMAYYLVAFPCGYWMAFRTSMKFRGLWAALSIAVWLVGLGEVWVILQTDWWAEVKRCQVRNKEGAAGCQSNEENQVNADNEEEDNETTRLMASERRGTSYV